MAESIVDSGYLVVEHLKSLSEIPKLALLLIEARKDEDLFSYMFSEGNFRIQLLKILFIQIDVKLESILNSNMRKETEILDALQNLCTSYGFSNREASRSFIIGKMSTEKQCSIWEKIIKNTKSIMNFENVVNELENDITKVDIFFRNPRLNDFLSLMPSVTGQNQLFSYCDIEIDSDIEKNKLKLEDYKAMEFQSPEKEKSTFNFNQPSILSQEQLLDSIQKWEIGFQNHLETNLRTATPDKTNRPSELSKNESDEKVSGSIKTLQSCCSKIEKNLEKQKLITELVDKMKYHNRTDDEKSHS